MELSCLYKASHCSPRPGPYLIICGWVCVCACVRVCLCRAGTCKRTIHNVTWDKDFLLLVKSCVLNVLLPCEASPASSGAKKLNLQESISAFFSIFELSGWCMCFMRFASAILISTCFDLSQAITVFNVPFETTAAQTNFFHRHMTQQCMGLPFVLMLQLIIMMQMPLYLEVQCMINDMNGHHKTKTRLLAYWVAAECFAKTFSPCWKFVLAKFHL